MSTPTVTRRLLEQVRTHHPRFCPGVEEARRADPERFDRYCELFLGWALAAFGEDSLPRMTKAFVRFTSDVNLAQARYEASGRYEPKSFSTCLESVYTEVETMEEYLLGVFLTNFLWAHHLDLCQFFEDRFLPRIAGSERIAEIAPGHGGWGLWALHALPGATLDAYDISPSSLKIAGALAAAAGLSQRARYTLGDALELDTGAMPPADACICCFLVEHLEDPDRLLENLARLLRPGGHAFFTGALTAAQIDHIYEFRHESELVLLAEQHGLRVLEMRSAGPRRTLSGANFLPRSAALIVQKKCHGTW
jgi:hypothetical protein